jgi:voltage-gated potassium channel
MASQSKKETETALPRHHAVETPVESGFDRDLLVRKEPESESQLREIITKPYRHPVLHWAAFVLSLIALGPPIMWLVSPAQVISTSWVWFDAGISVFFLLEFFTRSGFRWSPLSYSASRFYDFIAIVPVGVLMYYDIRYAVVWQWIILIARIIRVLDRLLGDGFVKRNVLALTAAFEEEITDRVMVRILDRVHDDLVRGRFAAVVGDALLQNKHSLLNRIKKEHPVRGFGAGLMRVTGLDLALERAEERTYDSIVEILKSPEMEKAIHDSIDSSFSVLRAEVEKKSWRENLGFQKRRIITEKKRIG